MGKREEGGRVKKSEKMGKGWEGEVGRVRKGKGKADKEEGGRGECSVWIRGVED